MTYEGSRVAGVFDFDWTKTDIRLFDVAQALLYFCARWDGEEAGSLDLERVVLFLKSYNEACKGAAFPGPLTAVEQAYMPLILVGASLFVLHVVIQSFYDTENADVEDWLMAVNHYIRIMHWMEKERIALPTERARHAHRLRSGSGESKAREEKEDDKE